jgi:hypothetical protein
LLLLLSIGECSDPVILHFLALMCHQDNLRHLLNQWFAEDIFRLIDALTRKCRHSGSKIASTEKNLVEDAAMP